MWIVFGDKEKTEVVPDGRTTERFCRKCQKSTRFHERRVMKTFELYFVGLFNHDARHVMGCDVCGATYVTDELPKVGTRQDGTVLGAVGTAFNKAATAIESAELGAKAEQTFDEVQKRIVEADLPTKAGAALNKTQQAFEGFFARRKKK